MISPKVFISYSRDSNEHCQKVWTLSNRLTEEGIDVNIDEYEASPPEGWLKWMEEQIRTAAFVIVVCTKKYFQKITGKEPHGKGLGVKWEGNLIYHYIYQDDSRNRGFIPVIFKSDQIKYIPPPLRVYTYYILDSEQGYESLYRRLTNQPRIKKPELGMLRQLPSVDYSSISFTSQIASNTDVSEAEYCPEERESISQPDIDKAGLLEKSNLASSFFQKPPDESKTKSVPKAKMKVLPMEKRKLLGLMAVSFLPLDPNLFNKIFPDKNWAKEMRKFVQQGILDKKQKEIYIPKSVKKDLLNDPEEVKSFHQEWINVLEPMKDYSDIPIFLAFHYFNLNLLDEAIMIMVDDIIYMEPYWENVLYLTFFETVSKSKMVNKIKFETRVNFYNAMGLCLSRNGNHEEALKWYVKLFNYSKRINNLWGIGQSYINSGYVYFEKGDVEKAETYYRKAIEHGRITGDKWLLGRSLHNLAMTIHEKDFDEASKLMNESITIKKAVGDLEGVAVASLGMGNLAVQQKKFEEALGWFYKTEKISLKYGLETLRSLALINIGSTNLDLNHPHKSIGYFQEARKIAESTGNYYARNLAIKGEANAWFKIDEFKNAEALYWDLFKLKKLGGNCQEMIIALHDVGLMLIRQKKFKEGRKILGRAIVLAKKIKEWDWVYQCHLAKTSSHFESGDIKGTLKILSDNAWQEEKKGFYTVAGQLWESYTIILILNNGDGTLSEIEQLFKRCIQCFEKAGNDYNHLSRIYRFLYQWRWDSNLFTAAIEALNKLEGIAEINNKRDEKIRAIDQRGICFQHLEKFKEAEESHRYSLKLARLTKNQECILNSLTNLGELLRRTHRIEESIKMSQEGEKIAGEMNDLEAQISIAHNRALAIRELGNIKESEKIILQCMDNAKKNKLWYEYVRAIRGLAHNNQAEGKNKLAERRYLEALKKTDMYGLHELKTQIIFDYSDLLNKEKRFEEAIEILDINNNHFKNYIDAHFFYMSLAEVYENKNDLILAKENWEKAKDEASKAGNQAIVSQCLEALDRIFWMEKEACLTEEELESDIQGENDPKEKSLKMSRYMGVLFARGNEKKAINIFKEALDIVIKHDFIGICNDLHWHLGDYWWGKNLQSKYKALQAYAVAMTNPTKDGDFFKYYIRIGKHVIDRLLTIEPRKRHNQIKALYDRLSSWLKKEYQREGGKIKVDDTMLWPLTVSMRLPLITGDNIFDYQIYKEIDEVLMSVLKGR